MDLNFFADPGLAPKPRSEIRIEQFALTAYPDGRRVRVDVELTPFIPADRPNIEITASKPDGTRVGSTIIIEAVQRAFSITLHIREAQQPHGEYHFDASLYYGDQSPQHTRTELLMIDGEQFDEQVEN